MIGQIISHYRILEKLGEGGMGIVYRAEDAKLKRFVALKFLSPALTHDKNAEERLINESRAASALDHPNICTIYEINQARGQVFIAMACVAGETLKEKLTAGPLELETALNIAAQVAEGLAEAHQSGVVHHDIKPSNIMLTRTGRVKLTDFGLARIAGITQTTCTGGIMGTPAYMSPEQVRGEKTDHRTDIWSLGVVLYEMVSGRRPFQGKDGKSLADAIVNLSPAPFTSPPGGIPLRLKAIVERMLQKSPELRYGSTKDFLSDLSGLEKDTWTYPCRFTTSERDTRFSIAVLPFTNVSGDPDQEYLCDGIAGEIHESLKRVRELRVVRHASPLFGNRDRADIREIGRELNVPVLLEGSVRRNQGRLRIAVHLTEVNRHHRLWSECYDRPLDEVFAVEDDITQAIVKKLRARVASGAPRAPQPRRAVDPKAHDLFLQGRYLCRSRTHRGLEEGIRCLERAVDRDPEFALAHAELGYAYLRLGIGGHLRAVVAYEEARTRAGRALSLDETLGLARALSAELGMWSDHDWTGSEIEIQELLSAEPSDDAAHQCYAHLLEALGRFQPAIDEMRWALDLNPLSTEYETTLGRILYSARRYNEAVEQLVKTTDRDPCFVDAYNWLALAYAEKNMYAQALKMVEKRIALGGAGITNSALLGCVHAAGGNRGEAERQLVHLKRASRATPAGHHDELARICARLGEKEAAFEWLTKAIDEISPGAIRLKVDPMFDSLRSDPRFERLLERMRLSD